MINLRPEPAGEDEVIKVRPEPAGEDETIKVRLEPAGEDEVLRYLGIKDKPADDMLMSQVKRAAELVNSHAAPELVYRIVPVISEEAEFLMKRSGSLKGIFSECIKICIFAVTLGSGVDELIRKTQISDMALAVAVEAAANAVIFKICRNFETDLKNRYNEENLYLTCKASPGEGEIPLSLQKDLCDMLNASRRIGLTITDSYMLIPGKSVTKICGLSENAHTYTDPGCKGCSMYERCEIREAAW